ncbi:hypothetical protein [Bacillus niameyensis]|nr:hypothetical protein [Bacillus niameyensis]
MNQRWVAGLRRSTQRVCKVEKEYPDKIPLVTLSDEEVCERYQKMTE